MHNKLYGPLKTLYEQSFNSINYSAKAKMQKIVPEQPAVTCPVPWENQNLKASYSEGRMK